MEWESLGVAAYLLLRDLCTRREYQVRADLFFSLSASHITTRFHWLVSQTGTGCGWAIVIVVTLIVIIMLQSRSVRGVEDLETVVLWIITRQRRISSLSVWLPEVCVAREDFMSSEKTN